MDRKSKTIYQLETPFTAVEWPKIQEKDQKLIFELLYSAISPIGSHRAKIVTSKGKRSQKRKRQEAKEKALLHENDASLENSNTGPPAPEIQKHVVVGLSSILRHLQALSEVSKPKTNAETAFETSSGVAEEAGGENMQQRPFAAIFALAPTPGNPNILTTQLPTLIYTTSLSRPSLPPTRLIPLSQLQALQLKSILCLARTSHIGILDSAPSTEALIAVIRENVPVVEVSWLDEVKRGRFMETKINAIESYAGTSKKETREKT